MEAVIDTSEVKKWKRYDNMIATELNWLPSLPCNWNMMRLKYLTSTQFQYGANESGGSQDMNAPRFVRITDIDENGNLRDETRCTLTQELAQPYLLNKGDILFARSGATVGKTFLYRESWGVACYAGYLIRFRPRLDRVLPEFVSYFASSKQYWAWIKQQQIQATIQNISADKYANLLLPLPSLQEQQVIATFLDRETARIDALIERKERLITLLEEKRQAVISHAMTKGLDPNAEMKEAGIPCIGEVPSHWQVFRNKSLLREIDCRSETGEEELLTVSHITGVTPRSEKLDVTMFKAETLEGYKVCRSGDFIINTMWAFMGAVGVSPLGGCVSPSYNVYRPRNPNDIVSAYFDLLYRTEAFKSEMFRGSKGIWHSRLRLYPDVFLNMRTPLPPRKEQEQILKHIENYSNVASKLSEALSNSIQRIKEYRTALISAAVTGQIDVREEV